MKIRNLVALITVAAIVGTSVPADITYAAASQYSQENGKERNADVSSVSVYKDTDYSFLKKFGFGTVYKDKTDINFMTAAEMISADDSFLREGKIVSTNGYYESGDGGAATYEVTSTASDGAVKLENGMYARLIPDTMDIDGKKWAVISARQLGASGKGEKSENLNLCKAFSCANEAASGEGIYRSIVYIPEGEYKCTQQLYVNIQNVNIVGDGDSTVIFTDNDYTDAYEFFMWSSGGKNLYLADFKVEAREKDMSRYYRQLSFVDCDNVYIYRVNLNIPQEAFSKDYFVDKQYTNLTFYAGNKNMTVDSCKMELMCSTYRGANLGILDFYCRGEENITVMNCELHDNARDEQVGIFTGVTNRDASFIKNVDFINNKIYSYTPLDKDAAGGHRTMCFTVAYNESRNIDDIYIAGNHFISQVDSKFMTFGNVDNCVVENNIIEADCTGNNGSFLFEAGNADLGDIKIDNNEFYITRYGKAAVCSGPIEFDGNRILSDAPVGTLMYYKGTSNANKITSFNTFEYLMNNTTVCKNNVFESYGKTNGMILVGGGGNYDENAYIENNVLYDYTRKYLYDYNAIYEAVGTIRGSYADNLYITGNEFYAPNMYIAVGREDNTQVPRGVLYCNAADIKKIVVSGNTLQQVNGIKQFACDMNSITEYSDNINIPYNEYSNDDEMYTEVYITSNGEKVTEIFTSDEKVQLGTNITKGARWYTSIEKLATVDNGTVTRKQYGDVTVYVVPDNGSTDAKGNAMAGKCVIHFQQAKAKDIDVEKDDITLVRGKKYDVIYKVNPSDKVSQKVTWTSSDENVATVTDDGIIEGVGVGSAEVTVSTADGSNISSKIKVTVLPHTVKKITLNNSVWDNNEAGVSVGDVLQLEVLSYTPSDAVNTGISKWESSNEQVAIVDENGLVKTVGQGQATIKAYSMDGNYYGKCTVWVNPRTVTGIETDYGQDYVTLTWDAQENVDGYKIYLYNEEKSTWELKATQKDNVYNAYSVKYGSIIEPDKDYRFAVSSYILRIDENGYRHYYEDDDFSSGKTNNVELHTYKDEIIKTFGKNIPSTIATTEGGKTYVKISIDKTKYEYWIEDTDIATIKDVSPNWDANLEITGVKNGYTNMYIKALDEKGYIKKIPVLVYEFEKFDLSVEGGVKSVQAKWQVKDIDSITGFRFVRSWIIPDNGIDVPISEINIEKSGDVYNCSYNFTGLKNDTSYKLKVLPYICMDEHNYAGGGSDEMTFSTFEYINVDTIDIDEVINLKKDENKKVFVKAGPDNATEPYLKYNVFDKEIADITYGCTEDGREYVEINAKNVGETYLNVIACDDNGYSKKSEIIVVPNKDEYAGDEDGEDENKNPEDSPSYSNFKKKKVSGFKMKKSTASSVNLKWNKLKGVSGYEISIYKNKKWVRLSNVTSKSNTKNINKLVAGAKYKFRIRGYKKSNGKRIYTKSVCCNAITRPLKVTVKSCKKYTQKAKITWKKIKADGYEIRYSTSKDFKKSKKINIKKPNGVSKIITGLKKKQKYYVKVRAYKQLNGKKYYGKYSKVNKM